MNNGVLLNLDPDNPGMELGTGMTGGIIYSFEGAKPGMGTRTSSLDNPDYQKIVEVLRIHEKTLKPEGLDAVLRGSPIFALNHPYLGRQEVDLGNFVRISPK